MKISFLIHNVYGIGGTNRTVVNLAEALAHRHEVEIVSVFRWVDRPAFDISARVALNPLLDMRPGRRDRTDERRTLPSKLIPQTEEFHRLYSALTDDRITRFLERTDSDVVVGTRPGLNLCVARLAPDSAVKVAQEHMTHEIIPDEVRAEMRALYPRLDASVTVTEADAEVFRATTPIPGLRLLSIPNSVPEPPLPPGRLSSKVVVAAGRLDEIKRYDLLVHAFAKVVAERPDWTLRIYGAGSEAAALAALIVDLGLHNNVFLMGRQSPLDTEWVKGSVVAVTSAKESFGMTLVEAMRCGVPVLSTACPVGPGEIIRHGEDGLLVPVGDVDAISEGLLRLIGDEELRRRMGAAARENSRRFDPAVVAGAYEELFQELSAAKGRRAGGARRAVSALAASGRRAREATRLRVATALPRRLRPAVGEAAQSLADCVVAADGTVTLSFVAVPGEPSAVNVVCRERADKQGERLVRVPVDRGGDGPRRAVLTPDTALAEGRWNVFVEDHLGRLHRVRARLCDLRELVERPSATLPVVRYVPYQTMDGYLAVRSWSRQRHAEVDAVWYSGEVITVAGWLVGETFGTARPTVVFELRGDLRQTVTVTGDSSGGADFRFDIPARQLAGQRLTRHDDWDVSVVTATSAEPVRLARLLDDVVERKKVYAYPSLRISDECPIELVDETPAENVLVKPYFTIDSDFSLLVSDR